MENGFLIRFNLFEVKQAKTVLYIDIIEASAFMVLVLIFFKS